MANAKYDHTNTLVSSGQLNWSEDRIFALLLQGAVFESADTRLSTVVNVSTARQVGASPISGRVTTADGSALGLPVVFDKVAKEVEHQMVFAQDDGTGDPLVLLWYDENNEANKLTLVNNGTLIVRPVLSVPDQPPQVGVWFNLLT